MVGRRRLSACAFSYRHSFLPRASARPTAAATAATWAPLVTPEMSATHRFRARSSRSRRRFRTRAPAASRRMRRPTRTHTSESPSQHEFAMPWPLAPAPSKPSSGSTSTLMSRQSPSPLPRHLLPIRGRLRRGRARPRDGLRPLEPGAASRGGVSRGLSHRRRLPGCHGVPLGPRSGRAKLGRLHRVRRD